MAGSTASVKNLNDPNGNRRGHNKIVCIEKQYNKCMLIPNVNRHEHCNESRVLGVCSSVLYFSFIFFGS